jgi:tRNA modification GTPase
MIPHPEDTIVALASAPGSGVRGLIRISGPKTAQLLSALFNQSILLTPGQIQNMQLQLAEFSALSVALHTWKTPRSYTGQDLAELHLLSAPVILEAIVAKLTEHGARIAQGGEFTLRGFLSGKRDLTRAEAVLAVIDANSRDELQTALDQLAGNLADPLQSLRDDLLNLLADIEAALDFVDEDIEFVGKAETILRIGKGVAHLTNLQKQLSSRSVGDRPFRVALIGPPNAGKSSLFNALLGRDSAIVSPLAGTTRDYVSRSMKMKDQNIELIDTAGWQIAETTIEAQAQKLATEMIERVDLLLECHPADATYDPYRNFSTPSVRVLTQIDRIQTITLDGVHTSAKTGSGVSDLKLLIESRAKEHRNRGMAPTLARCRGHIDVAIKALRQVHQGAIMEDPAEVLAVGLRNALDEIGAMVGAVYTNDLLDRIFSRFCIGK